MNHITWSRHQEGKDALFGFLRNKRFYKYIYPLLLITSFYLFAIAFAIQNSLIYKKTAFTEQRWLDLAGDTSFNKAYKIALLDAKKIDGEIFKVYVIETHSTHKDVVLFHGARLSIANHKEIACRIADMGYNVIIPFCRGFGPSAGEMCEINTMVDMLCLKECLQGRSGSLHAVAQSHGCAVLLYFDKISGYGLKKIVLENPFLNLKTVIASLSWQSYLRSFVIDNWENDIRIRHYKESKDPVVLVMHGSEDTFVKFKDNGDVLVNGCESICVKELKGARHTNGYTFDEFYELIHRFFNNNLK